MVKEITPTNQDEEEKQENESILNTEDEELEEIVEDEESEEGEWIYNEDEDTDEEDYEVDDRFEDFRKKGLFQQTTGMLSTLPMEIFFDILSRVPIKSISQCRWVCKAWYNSIKHPLFIEMQHKRAMESGSHFVIINETRGAKEYFLMDHEGLDMQAPQFTKLPDLPRAPQGFFQPVLCMDSCNGLLFFQEPPYLICNPITGDWIILPKSPKDDLNDVVSCFGFDAVTGDYKVMRVVKINEDFAEAEVYTLGSNCWRTIVNVPYTFEAIVTNVFVDGAFHWLGTETDKCKKAEVIVSFKLGTEVFSVQPLPPCFKTQKKECSHNLLELGGRLCVIRCFMKQPTEVWVMKSYGDQSSWSKDYVFRDLEPWCDPFEPIKVMENGELLLMCNGEVMGYFNPITQRYKLIYLEGNLPERRSIWQALIHVGSLNSPMDICRRTKSNS